ncbi:MAG: hypothetical protein MUE67_04990 [Anaerolineales bacterium]|nr:hypothetical protein [Anaerolineales bacterium]
MAWQDQLNADSVSWLVTSPSPGVRYLALRDLAGLPSDHPDVLTARDTAHESGPIAAVLDQMTEPGYWSEPGSGYNPKYFSTVWSIILLAQLGAHLEQDPRLARACTYIINQALAPGGQFASATAPSGTADCLQGNLCWALLELGSVDPRLDAAFEWMARTVTGEGLAPAGDRQANLRYYAGKCGPNFACGANNRLPCAWGAAKVMLAFGRLPASRRTPLIERAIQQGIDFLFSVDPATAAYPNGYSSKPNLKPWPDWAWPAIPAWRIPSG